jgi:hypothetical protein
MFKRGVCTVQELIAAESRLRGKRFRKNCYIGLYEEALAIGGPRVDSTQEAILKAFAIANAVFKRTEKQRFSAFDATTVQMLREVLALKERCTIHDMAVSDGRTACEFFDKLLPELGDALEFYATDACVAVTALRRRGGRTTTVVDREGKILQIVFPPFVLSTVLREQWLPYPVNRLLRVVLMRTAVKRLIRLFKEGGNGLERHEIRLLCREAREHLERNGNFHVETYDMLARSPRNYTVVRAMNIFNLSYFSDDVIARAVRNLLVSLDDGGVFVTGSNQDAGSTVNGTIYRKYRGGLVPMYVSGEGSQIDHIVTRAN